MNTTATDPSASHLPPDPQPGVAPTSESLPRTAVRPFAWSLRRELWEHRAIYIAPLAVAALLLLGFLIGLVRLANLAHGALFSQALRLIVPQYDFTSFALMLTYFVVAVIYCLEALHGERRDRSILFWKSLPVSDLTAVLAKASVPLLILPLVTFVVTVALEELMYVASTAVAYGLGVSTPAAWSQLSLLTMWLALLYHLVSLLALYYAPIYGWLMLVSCWARRVSFLWAVLPVVAIIIIERMVFHTGYFAQVIWSRLTGGPDAIHFPPPAGMPLHLLTLANIGRFLISPGLWGGLLVCAAFLAAAVWLRRYRGPI